ncbi:MAG TPA: hypothetical protein PLB89_02250 [Flavobacteriales bacterium]|nr:hypothetical protein [Flavobacteriales bacterium]
MRHADSGRATDGQRANGPGILHIHATYTEAYCGGEDPGPEGMPRPYPWSGRMYIRKAIPDSTGRFVMNDPDAPLLDSIQMNSDGHGWLDLPAGTYLIFDRDRVDRTRYDQLIRDHEAGDMYTDPIDKACMDRWLHGPFPFHTITAGDTLHMPLPLHGQCPSFDVPCVVYRGPVPP